ncbi:endogenous retrovirus group K, member 6 [Gossypium australe]|uniref:Endogenous retrovirus group K, member 6 n=1 Tax=Gossypium australe TaxID=47621 RepID=A0A5B6WU23_9ROSI|nr:endogenous retrovirus group K, member 6 [Gossypium australe]
MEFGAPNPLISCFILKGASKDEKNEKRAKNGENGPKYEMHTAWAQATRSCLFSRPNHGLDSIHTVVPHGSVPDVTYFNSIRNRAKKDIPKAYINTQKANLQGGSGRPRSQAREVRIVRFTRRKPIDLSQEARIILKTEDLPFNFFHGDIDSSIDALRQWRNIPCLRTFPPPSNTVVRGRAPRSAGNVTSNRRTTKDSTMRSEAKALPRAYTIRAREDVSSPNNLPVDSTESVVKVSKPLGKYVLVDKVCKGCPLMIWGYYFPADLMLFPFDNSM